VNATLQAAAAQAVVPVLRCADAEDAVATARACARAGMRVIELTCTTPEVERALEELRGDGLVLGLGTITDRVQVRTAARAGAAFVVSFKGFIDMVEEARQAGLPAIPAALTPTEVAACVDAGAEVVKLFPARLIEPAYLRDLAAVMPGVRCMVTGGVPATAEAVRPWLDAGAVAVGIGSDLGTARTVGADAVEQRARAIAALGAH
jgi:2-dehydro-3-deoxyphosphogluconate aldolase / (4S)-4-hydroxy-2-oxoglutarate aldolase